MHIEGQGNASLDNTMLGVELHHCSGRTGG
jgi:hypothetical protein